MYIRLTITSCLTIVTILLPVSILLYVTISLPVLLTRVPGVLSRSEAVGVVMSNKGHFMAIHTMGIPSNKTIES